MTAMCERYVRKVINIETHAVLWNLVPVESLGFTILVLTSSILV
jgi:hypothetical protein